MGRRLSQNLVDLAVKLYGELGSGNAVARRLEVSHSTAYRLLNAGGVDLPDRHGPEVQAKKKKLHGLRAMQAAEDYQAGMSKKDMCAKYGVGWWAIRTAVRDLGLPVRLRGGRFRRLTEEEGQAAIRLYWDEKLSQVQVSNRLECAQAVIGRVLARAGIPIRGRQRPREGHGAWKGGRVQTSGGYVGIHVEKDDLLYCMADSNGYVLEHRLVMARALGRPLADHETVHHLNGDKTDNRLSNLQLRFGRHGRGVVLKCRCCGSNDIEAVET